LVSSVLFLVACRTSPTETAEANAAQSAPAREGRLPHGRVRIIATGGTIAGVAANPGSPNYDPGQVTIDAILHAVPDVTTKVSIDGSQLVDPESATADNPHGYVNVSSAFIRERHWIALANAANKALNDDGYDAVIITHGTDSIEETAFFLQLTVHSPKPVILVGAMRPAQGSADPDGPDNIRAAVRVALDPDAQGKGVMVAQNFAVVPAYDIFKVQSYLPTIDLAHEELPCPFAAPTYGNLAKVRKQGDFDHWAVDWRTDNALLGTDARALAIKFDVSNVQAPLPKTAELYESVGADSPGLLTSYYFQSQPDVKNFILVGAGGNCVSTQDTVNFVAGQAARTDVVFLRTSRIAKVWCKTDDPHLLNSIGSGTMSAVHTKILLKLLRLQAEAAGATANYAAYVHQWVTDNLPYSPDLEPTLPYPN
jgi:L-asparaginase/Glu-tRNA(Gln) amidotransferase subunit D